MKDHLRRRIAAVFLGVVGLALAACTDYRPNPTYNYGVATAPEPCTNCNYGNWYRWHGGQWHVD